MRRVWLCRPHPAHHLCIWRIGQSRPVACCFWCGCWGSAFRHWRGRLLIVKQIYNAGARSTGHHHAVRTVPRHGVGPAGLQPAAAIRLRIGAGSGGGTGTDQGARTGAHGIAVRGSCRHFAVLGNRPDGSHGSARGDGDDGRRSGASCGRAALSRAASSPCRCSRAIFDCIGIYGAQLVGVTMMRVDPARSGRRCRVRSGCAT
jgi:hypothetical protein